ncbi:helix-turn-helix domain-containing protein [Pseudodonghicola flavimaris]|uniref:Helix-turn-helix domain-containing protein n=1 Tax=Pseudodonghicola flavimaris TaxID=3050036 RepID=A0ABT7EZC0_9RHOB|nr:helix-turn-helix domain-containing protein [Pseudodonghicola flavimaris]MDK3017600.1 helix-turn-helix domain-containing protein [Pseudodonghicola flavimaris]
MTQQLIAVDANALGQVLKRLDTLETLIRDVKLVAREEWVSIQEAARLLQCDPSTIRRKINSGELQAKGSGKSRRVRLD